MNAVQAACVASFAVLTAVIGYRIGIWLGVIIGLVSAFTYVFSGLGTLTDPMQTIELKDRKKKKGQTLPRIVKGLKETKKVKDGSFSTLYENFQSGVKKAGNRPCLGWRPSPKEGYKTQTYNEVNKRIQNFGSGLYHIGVEQGDRIGFYAKNSIYWVMGAEACNAYSLTSVAIYDTLGEENREYIVNQSEIRGICSTSSLLTNICDLANSCPKLKYVILMDSVDEKKKQQAAAVNLELFGFEELEKLGEEHFISPIPPKPDDLAILMYTSGTTSRPKGVMISHKNICAVIQGVVDVIPNFSCQDSYFSYLPLAHILERAAEASMFNQGAAIGFYQGDIRKLTEDVVAWKPTIYAGVPKVYQRIMNTVNKKISDSPAPIRILFGLAYELKKKCIQVGLPSGLFDKTIFKKVHEALGGRVRYFVSGGAPLSAETHEFIRICFGAPVCQGYGLTETCGGTSVTPAAMVNPYEKAGTPLTCCEVKLVSAGKYSVDSNPPQGEVCVRGENVTLGYYKNEEKTNEVYVVEEDGERWFHTGDVGQWNADGTLSIVGRVKDIFKLDSGEYIAPERLETIYCQCKYLSNIFVHGDSDKSNIVAIAIPDVIAAKQWADENGVKYGNDTEAPNVPAEICASPEFNKLIVDDLKAIAESAKLNRYEQVPVVHIDGTYWDPNSGLVTDAMKNKRDPLAARYQKELKALYAKLGQ